LESKHIKKQLDILAGGSALKRVVLRDIKNFKILFPPLPEQRKIAEILETIDNAIEKTDKIIEKYKRIKQGLMQELLTKGIDENGQIRSEETHRFKDSPLGRILERVIAEITKEPTKSELRELDFEIIVPGENAGKRAMEILRDRVESGDTDVIAALLEHPAKVVATDDRRLRVVCRDLGGKVTGTLGIVIHSVKIGRISKKEAFEILRMLDRTGFGMSVELYERVREIIEIRESYHPTSSQHPEHCPSLSVLRFYQSLPSHRPLCNKRQRLHNALHPKFFRGFSKKRAT
jgi:predicted nucleic acid-binding protein